MSWLLWLKKLVFEHPKWYQTSQFTSLRHDEHSHPYQSWGSEQSDAIKVWTLICIIEWTSKYVTWCCAGRDGSKFMAPCCSSSLSWTISAESRKNSIHQESCKMIINNNNKFNNNGNNSHNYNYRYYYYLWSWTSLSNHVSTTYNNQDSNFLSLSQITIFGFLCKWPHLSLKDWVVTYWKFSCVLWIHPPQKCLSWLVN